MNNVKGYKVFEPDWTCRGFQYEVGKTYKHEGNIKVCGSGFHFCQKASDCFNYYSFNNKNKVAEVVAIGIVETDDDVSVTNEITILREIDWQELLTIVNEGKNCTGIGNTGDNNVGHYNAGNYNTGRYNVGDYNVGYWNVGSNNVGGYNVGSNNTGFWNVGSNNVGDWNVGDYNVGDWNVGSNNVGGYNVGDYNVGYWNVGSNNVGEWNIIDFSNGLFNTKQKTIDIFDKPSNWTLTDWLHSDIRHILFINFTLTEWVHERNMTDEEKYQHPEYKTTNGYLKTFEFKEACNNMWNRLTYEEKRRIVTGLPNFDADKFKLITGIEVEEELM